MKIVVVGSGAIGSLYGGLMLGAGASVTLVGRTAHIEAIKSGGLKITGVMGEHLLHPDATVDVKNIREADFVFITTKTYDTDVAAESIRHLSDSGAYIVVLQNGIGTEKRVADLLGTRRVLRATTCAGALKVRPGEVYVTGRGVTEIGTHYPENRAAVQTVMALLAKAGFDVRSSDNIEGLVWTKTIVNCGINPVGALTGMTNGEIHSNALLRGVVIKLVEEAVAVVRALGVSLTTDDPIRYTLGTAKATSKNINSMLQDFQNGRRTEIDAITGTVVRLGRQLGVPTPVSESMYGLIRAIESKYLEQGQRATTRLLTVPELIAAVATS